MLECCSEYVKGGLGGPEFNFKAGKNILIRYCITMWTAFSFGQFVKLKILLLL